jgi:hypothetical protein
MDSEAGEISADRRFRLRREASGGVVLELARGGEVVLDLRRDGARVDVCAFDANGRALLHLRLSRTDGSLAMYPATLDLDTGLFFHGDPRHAHPPAGQAADLERIAAGARPPECCTPPVRWPSPAELAAAALPLPPPALPAEPVAPPADAEVFEWISAEGDWRVRSLPHLRIADTLHDVAVLDLQGTQWDCTVRMNPAANQLWINVAHPNARSALDVFVDLDLQRYWECDARGAFLPDGRLAAPLAELQARLSRMTLPGPGAVVPFRPRGE